MGTLAGWTFAALVVAVLWWVWRRTPGEPKVDAEAECQVCGYDLRGSPNRCPECGTVPIAARLRRLHEDWPSSPIEPRRPSGDEEPVVVYMSGSDEVVNLLVQHLGARGIPCELQEPPAIEIIGARRVVGDWRLLVWSDDVVRAKQITERILADDLADPEPLGRIV